MKKSNMIASIKHLHSTMYLLNHGQERVDRLKAAFTFHYVSIKSGSVLQKTI